MRMAMFRFWNSQANYLPQFSWRRGGGEAGIAAWACLEYERHKPAFDVCLTRLLILIGSEQRREGSAWQKKTG
jgi:hypothetical protein